MGSPIQLISWVRCGSPSTLVLFSLGLALSAMSSTGCLGPEHSAPASITPVTVETEAIAPLPPSPGEGIEVRSGSGTVLAERKNVIRMASIGAFVPDPVVNDDGLTRMLLSELYSGLTRISDSSVEPAMAERYSVSDDGLLYEFVLRQNLKFSDGDPVSALDFKWSWERALNPSSTSRRARLVLGSILGARAVIDGESQELAGVEVIDDRTLHVRLLNMRSDFPALLTDPVASVLKRENVESWGIEQSSDWFEKVDLGAADPHGSSVLPVGTGPFALAEFDAIRENYVFKRNDHFWDEPPRIDRIEFLPLADAVSESDEGGHIVVDPSYFENAFDRGEIDIIGEIVEIAELVNAGEIEISGNLRCFETAPTVDFLAFNSALPPYDDIHFRRALAAAVNIDAITVGTMRESGFERSSSIQPPNFPGYDNRVEFIQFDLDFAASELNASKYPDETDHISLTYHNDGTGLTVAEFETLARNWQSALEIDAEMRFVGIFEYAEIFGDGEIEMIRLRVTPFYPDPYALLGVFESLFGEENPKGDLAAVEALLEAASSERDAAVRLQMYRDIEQHVLDEALAFPLKWNLAGECVRVQPWVHGYYIPKFGGSRFKDVWIDSTHARYPFDR